METEIKEEIKVEKVKVKKPGEIIFIPMWMKALPICDNEYTSNIAKKINVTYSHLLFLLDAFKERGYINMEKQGRLNISTLTVSGRELSVKCTEIIKMIEKK